MAIQLRSRSKDQSPKRFAPLARYVEKSLLVGVILACLALIVIGVGTQVKSDFWGTILTVIGGALVPAAVLNAVLDPLLKNVATEDILEVLNVRDAVARAGAREMGLSKNVALDAILGTTNMVEVLVLDPTDWHNQDFPTILDHCEAYAADVVIRIPAPEPAAIASLADRYRSTLQEIEDLLRRLPEKLVRAWDSRNLKPGATLKVYFYEGMPSVGLARTEDRVLIEFGPAVQRSILGRTSYRLVGDLKGSLWDWARSELPGDSYEPTPTLAQIRPVSSATSLTTSPGETLPIKGQKP